MEKRSTITLRLNVVLKPLAQVLLRRIKQTSRLRIRKLQGRWPRQSGESEVVQKDR